MKSNRCYRPKPNESLFNAEIRIMNEIERERQFDALREQALNDGVSRTSLDELERICGKSIPILKEHMANVRLQRAHFRAMVEEGKRRNKEGREGQ